jgi:diacylglycerol O-acyltransferase
VEARTIPLGPEDRAILDLESPTVAGHTCKILRVRDELAVDEVRAQVAERISSVPELRRRLAGSDDAPAWAEESGVDLEAHVTEGHGPLTQDALRAFVAQVFAERLDRSRPLWQMNLVDIEGSGTAVVWRIHHALADGTTAMRLAREVLFDPRDSPAPAQRAKASVGDEARRRHHLARILEREIVRSKEPSPFDGSIGAERQIEFARVPMGPLHDASKALATATLNDAVLACVAGGLRRWMELHEEEAREVRVMVPVSLHDGADGLGNRDSFFCASLPVGDPDPVSRLVRIRTETARRKAEHVAEDLHHLERGLAGISPRAEHLMRRFESSPRRFALNVSNVPGPRNRERILGSHVTALHTLAEIGERHALRVAVVSYAGELCFGLCADPHLVHDLDAIARGIDEEAAVLSAAS